MENVHQIRYNTGTLVLLCGVLVLSESSIEKKVVKWANARGVDSLKIETSSRVGFPDRMFFVDGGKPLFIEFKKSGKVATKKQAQVIRDLLLKSYDAIVCDDAGDAIVHLERRMESARVSARRC